MYDVKRSISVTEDIERMEYLEVVLHDCHVFLQKWKVLISDREEPTVNAFVAITELEVELRKERSAIGKRLGVDIVPF